MEKIFIIGLIFILGLMVNAFGYHGELPKNQEKSSIKEILMALEDGAMERWRQGDPYGWVEISAPEVIYVDPSLTKPIVGLEAYKAYLAPLKGEVSYKGSLYRNVKAAIYGDVAVLTYNYKGVGEFNDRDQHPVWNTTEVYCRFGDNWKIIHTHWSYIKHKLPAQLEVPLPVVMKPVEYDGILAELMKLESTAMERWRKGDPWGFTDISAAEVTYFDSGTAQRLDGLDALKKEYAKRAGKIHYDVMEFIDPIVQLHGETAVLFYRFFSTLLNADGSIRQRTPWNCTEVFTKIGNQWRIVHTHWSLMKGERNKD